MTAKQSMDAHLENIRDRMFQTWAISSCLLRLKDELKRLEEIMVDFNHSLNLAHQHLENLECALKSNANAESVTSSS